MATTFANLSKKTVHIGIDDNGGYIEVPMLTVADFGEYRDAQEKMTKITDVTDSDQMKICKEVREKMIALATKVMPIEFQENLRRLDYIELSRLVLVLCNGNDDAKDDDPKKKVTMPSQLQPAAN